MVEIHCVMAEKAEEAASQNILCPLCLDVFDNASMLICGHTFCKQCLERYDAAHQDLDHMVCPLCRKVTKLDESRVTGLPTNFTVKGLVDEYHGSHGGINAVLEGQPKCTACERQGDAVSFCYECGNYMCANCDHGHSHLTSFFKGHQVVSMKDVVEGTAHIGQVTDKCLVHKPGKKELFCEDCKVYICLMCTVLNHRDHKIKHQADLEKEIRQKVDDIIKRSNDRKNEFEKHIQDIESKRKEIDTAIQKLQGNIKEAFTEKLDKLKENERMLITETQLLRENCGKELDAMKSGHRQKIKAISSCVSLVAKGRLRHLEKDSLTAHSLISNDLKGLLEEAIDEASVTDLMKRTSKTLFIPAGDTLLDLGRISSPRMAIGKVVDLPYPMSGITRLSDDSILVGYGKSRCDADKVENNGNVQSCRQNSFHFYDIAIQSISQILAPLNRGRLSFFSAKDWSRRSDKAFSNDTGYSYPYLTVSSENEIIAANRNDRIHILDPTVSRIKHSITTVDKANQALATKSGVIVSSSCSNTPSVVRLYDRDGKSGDPIAAKEGEYLYPAVDEENRVFIASVNKPAGRIQITLYLPEGLKLKKVVEFEELELTLNSAWCYLVSLSRNKLAFACDTKVYFLTFSPGIVPVAAE
ncbi:E3 ubiquitin-protein ligase TRIM71-like [Strongylocentrotus purpuratus]|uniref:Uncharacterized protein n=1 Tax=Strongylocentrotus purpuratus TaxID=7668 RepID=A0A7M7SYI6_STRPU|nr:E3 ubiquitin-protein ligase TRIM71-like [Strongylocentrotus purpuratus]